MVEMRRRQARPAGRNLVRASSGALAAGCLLFACCCTLPVRAEVRTQLTVTGPFDKHDHRGSRIIPYFEKTGTTNVMQSFIRMTPEKPDSVGTLWSRVPVGSSDFSLEWQFRISGSEAVNHGDTIALIISPTKYEAGQGGPFFGIDDNFTGLAIIVNTNRQLLSKGRKPGEPAVRHRDVSVVANNGTRRYDDLIENLEGCTANVRFDERRSDFNVLQSTRVRLKVAGNTVAVEVDARNVGRWRRCATIAHLDMPDDWATESNIGVIAQTSDRTNNHDLFSLRTYTDPNDAWDMDTYDGDEDQLDGLVNHMEHELFNVHDSLKETIESLAQAEREAESRLEDLEENLSRSVMQSLEARVANLEVQVQTSVIQALEARVANLESQIQASVSRSLDKEIDETYL
ncbi:unnamed protein product [Scytosiphon promiscuus]